ncbi:MAG: hypothetical protein ACI7YS_11120 [Flavobacterium sp.]
MKKSILNLAGVTALSKAEQKSVQGGFTISFGSGCPSDCSYYKLTCSNGSTVDSGSPSTPGLCGEGNTVTKCECTKNPLNGKTPYYLSPTY